MAWVLFIDAMRVCLAYWLDARFSCASSYQLGLVPFMMISILWIYSFLLYILTLSCLYLTYTLWYSCLTAILLVSLFPCFLFSALSSPSQSHTPLSFSMLPVVFYTSTIFIHSIPASCSPLSTTCSVHHYAQGSFLSVITFFSAYCFMNWVLLPLSLFPPRAPQVSGSGQWHPTPGTDSWIGIWRFL